MPAAKSKKPTPIVLTKPIHLIKKAVEIVPIIEPTNCEDEKKPDCSSFKESVLARNGRTCPRRTVTIPTTKKLKWSVIFSGKLFVCIGLNMIAD